MEMNQGSTSSSRQGASRPSPGLTLESLSFKNFPINFKQKPQKGYVTKDKTHGGNLVKYSKIKNDDELQRNITNYELFFEKNPQQIQPKKSKQNVSYPSKADIYYPKNYRDSNAEVLSKILDSNSEFSPNSPSNLKIVQNEMDNIQKEEMKRGIEESKENTVENQQEHEHDQDHEHEHEQMESEPLNKKLTINQSYAADTNMNQSYLEGLAQVLSLVDPVFNGLSMQEKFEKFVALTEDERRQVRLGALVALYIMLKKYSSEISEEHKGILIEKIVALLQNYNQQEEIFLVACLEICSLYGPIDILSDNLGLICMFITDFDFPKLQKATFNCLMSMGYEGIKSLVDLASKDYQDYQSYILNNLIQTPHIQKNIIIKALINEVYSNNSQRRTNALAALNRMHDLVNDPDTLEKLEYFFNEPKIKKDYISSILRTSGPEGEAILLNELRTNKDFAVRAAIANSFSYRLPKYQNYLEMRLDKNDTYSISKNLPGSFCTYHGNIAPFIENKNLTIEELISASEYQEFNETENTLENIQENTSTQEEYLEVNTRDFFAALQRMLFMGVDHSSPQLVHNGFPNSLDNIDLKASDNNLIEQNFQFFDLSNVKATVDQSNEILQVDDAGRYYVSDEAVKGLVRCLKDYSAKVREAAVTSLGIIGYPEALPAVDGLVDNINDEDVNVRSKIIWAIGRTAQGLGNQIIPFILEGAKSNMWKVKKASLYTLGQLGDRCAQYVCPYLVKLLKESPINKQIVAQTLVRLGLEGESVLLKIMGEEPDSNYKLKSAIIRAFSLADINSTNADFIIEYVFRQGKNGNPIVRREALFTIKVLADKAEEKLTYLKRRNVIPFYYDKLKDKDLGIQRNAIACIVGLGPQGELIFIEGLTRDPNPIIRSNCAIGLAELGVHTLRTLLVGLHDENAEVRKVVERAIVNQMNIRDVLDYFGQDTTGNQIVSLKIAVKDILEKNYQLSMFTINYFNQLLNEISKFENDNKGHGSEENVEREIEENPQEHMQEEYYDQEGHHEVEEEEEEVGPHTN